jgi:kynurenine formamidase
VQPNETVLFRTDWSRYLDTGKYYAHPELTPEVVKWLIERCVNIVGIDALGLGREERHGEYDRMFARHDVYVLENLTNLAAIPQNTCTVYCFPLPLDNIDAIPARVIVDA